MSKLSGPARRVAVLSTLVIGSLLAFAGTASAGSVTSASGTGITYTGDSVQNDVTVGFDGSTDFGDGQPAGVKIIIVTDSNGITPVAPCRQGGDSLTAECPALASNGTISLGGGPDSFYEDDLAPVPGSAVITVYGEDGSDSLSGTTGTDTLNGGTANDYLTGGAGDTLNGDDGNDDLNDSGGASTTIHGGNDDDIVYAPSAADGNDTYTGDSGSFDYIDYSARFGAGTLTLNLATGVETEGTETDSVQSFENAAGRSQGTNTLTGTDGNNSLYGGDGVDSISGAGGNDTLYGGNGGTGLGTLDGGSGDDEIYGGDGADVVNAGAGSDYVEGDQAGDTINGGDDGDYLVPGTGEDTVDGGNGADWVDYYRSAAVTVNLTQTTNNAGETGENDDVIGVENVQTGSAADTVVGDGNANEIDDGGGAGDNVTAGGGNDTLYIRDTQVDTANCGDGTDTVFADANDSLAECESINTPFVPPVDSGPTTPPVSSSPPPVVNNTPPAPIVPPITDLTAGLAEGTILGAKTQQSPDLSVLGTVVVKKDGSTVVIKELYNGIVKASKVTVVGSKTLKNVKAGFAPFKVKLNKKAAKAFKKKKLVKVTLKVTVTPPGGKAVTKSAKRVLKRGKLLSNCASARAQMSC